MALLKILHFPDPRLHLVAKPVAAVDADIRQLAADMAETMYAAPGIGLAATQVDRHVRAATQVDRHVRLIVVDISEEKNRLLTLINPRIVMKEGEAVREEGCLSVPGIYDKVTRAEHIRVEALDLEGKPFQLDAVGLLAVSHASRLTPHASRLTDHAPRLRRHPRIRRRRPQGVDRGGP
ncbi:MAG: peptide deformylase [Thiobacillaceae bacterium]|nr:peptide deformylase [Thiobacillaceae bacterium]